MSTEEATNNQNLDDQESPTEEVKELEMQMANNKPQAMPSD